MNRGPESNPTQFLGVPFKKPTGVKIGIGLTTPSPELAQIMANSGFDIVLIDMEHGPISIETAYRMVTAIRGTPAVPMIRVASNDPTLIKLALDTGARSLAVPMVNSRAEAEAAVAAAKYPPRGIRGFGPFRTQYQWDTTMFDYAKRANDEISVTVLVEHPVAIENLDEILSVDGLDSVWVVPFDLAVNMGHIDGPNHPDVREAMGQAAAKIRAKGMPVGSFAVTPEQGKQAIAAGCSILFLGFDVMFVPAAVQRFLQGLE